MKKRLFLLCLISILAIGLVSASYECDNGTLKEDQGGIHVAEEISINRVGVGLASLYFVGGSEQVSAELFFDAAKLSLNNATPSIEVNLVEDDYDVELISLSEDLAEIKVEGSTEEIEKNEIEKINDLQVLLIETEGTYPGVDGRVSLLVGRKKVTLTMDNYDEIVKIDDVEYLLELSSAGGDAVIILVKTCEGGDFVEIEDEEVCDSNNLNLCLDETDCTDAGGYWYNDLCNGEEQNDSDVTPDNGTNESDTECELGVREDETYCDENKEFISQKELEAACDNDYECESENCQESLCSIKESVKIPGFNLQTIALAAGITLIFLIVVFFLMRNRNNKISQDTLKSSMETEKSQITPER